MPLTRRAALSTLVAAPAFVRAQTIQERGRKIMEEALAALGGPKFMAMRDRTEEGRAYSYYRERLSGLSLAKIETYYDDTAKDEVHQREKQSFGKKFDSHVLYEGNGKGWDITFRVARMIPDENVLRWQESRLRNIMYVLRCRLNEPGLIFERKGLDVFDNQPVEIVEMTDEANREVKYFLSQTTKLPVRQLYRRQNPKDRIWDEEETRYSKYRQVSGVMWPWAISQSRNGERQFEIYSNEVTINKGLSLADFQLPKGATILKPL